MSCSYDCWPERANKIAIQITKVFVLLLRSAEKNALQAGTLRLQRRCIHQAHQVSQLVLWAQSTARGYTRPDQAHQVWIEGRQILPCQDSQNWYEQGKALNKVIAV